MKKIKPYTLAKALLTIDDSDHQTIDVVVKNLVSTMASQGNWRELGLLIDDLQTLLDEKNNLVRVTINTNEKLNQDQLEKIEKFTASKFGSEKIILTQNIDPHTTGLTILANNRFFDLSVDQQLAKFRKKLTA